MARQNKYLKRILATAGCGVGLAGALFWIGAKQKEMDKEVLRLFSGANYTVYVCDTINIPSKRVMDAVLNGEIQAMAGSYDRLQDTVHTYYYNDLTNTEYCRKITEFINNQESMASYHELRHALNTRYMWRYNRVRTPDIFVYDEISARVAEYLACLGKKKPLQPGIMSPQVTYNISTEYELKDIADTAIKKALKEMEEYFDLGVGIFAEATYYSQYDPEVYDIVINKKMLVDEIMTFEINGKPQNFLRLASKQTQNEVAKYVAAVNKCLNCNTK